MAEGAALMTNTEVDIKILEQLGLGHFNKVIELRRCMQISEVGYKTGWRRSDACKAVKPK